MAQVENPLSTTIQQFFQSERAGSLLLTVFALLAFAFALANSPIGTDFVDFGKYCGRLEPGILG